MNNKKRFAVFFAGVAASQLVTHGAFALAGIGYRILGIEFTQAIQSVAAVVWGVLAIAPEVYGWKND